MPSVSRRHIQRIWTICWRSSIVACGLGLGACGWTSRDAYFESAAQVQAHQGDGSRMTWQESPGSSRSVYRPTDLAEARSGR